MSKIQSARNNISTIKEERQAFGDSYTGKISPVRAARLKIEEAEANHRRREERAESNHRRWRECVHTWICTILVSGIVLLCAAILLLSYSAEDKKWASAIITHGATALTTYFGVKARNKS